jgi:hypothetical protein
LLHWFSRYAPFLSASDGTYTESHCEAVKSCFQTIPNLKGVSATPTLSHKELADSEDDWEPVINTLDYRVGLSFQEGSTKEAALLAASNLIPSAMPDDPFSKLESGFNESCVQPDGSSLDDVSFETPLFEPESPEDRRPPLSHPIPEGDMGQGTGSRTGNAFHGIERDETVHVVAFGRLQASTEPELRVKGTGRPPIEPTSSSDYVKVAQRFYVSCKDLTGLLSPAG